MNMTLTDMTDMTDPTDLTDLAAPPGPVASANPSASFDVDAARRATPGCSDVAFLNNAGAALPTQETLDAVFEHLNLESRIGGYAAGDAVIETLAQGRADLAQLVGGKPNEIAISGSDTASWTKAIWGWVAGGNIPANATVFVDRLSYHSHYSALFQLQQLVPFTIKVLPANPDGTIDLTQLAHVDTTNVALVSATMIGTHCGNVADVAPIGAWCKSLGVPLFLDGCQALGHFQVDVRALGCSVFTGTGRKWLRGPRGTGMLWVAEEFIERFSPPGTDATNTVWNTDGSMRITAKMNRFEEFEAPIASYVGLASAAKQALKLGVDATGDRIRMLADQFRADLQTIDRVTVQDAAPNRCGIVTFTVDGTAPGDVVAAAAKNNASISASSATWATLDMSAKSLDQVVRVSPHYYNTTEELGRVLEAVGTL
jgi:cysteine desulfurase / selenocysteine lyase